MLSDISFSDINLGSVTVSEVAVIALTSLTIVSKPATINNSVQLSITKVPTNTTQTGVIWTSSNTAVATVDTTGLVTAITAGSATITVTSTSNSTISDSFTATYSRTVALVSVTSVSILGAKTMTVGGTTQLTATVLPSNANNIAVTWSSSNTALATVSSSGLVTAIAAGSVNIIATSNSNNTVYSIATISVSEISVTGVSVSGTASVTVGGTNQLYANVLPVTASNTAVIWSSSNTALATVSSSGLVTAIAAGSVTISATSVSDNTKIGIEVITVNAVVVNTTTMLFHVSDGTTWWYKDTKLNEWWNRCNPFTGRPYNLTDTTNKALAGVTLMTQDQAKVYEQYSYVGAKYAIDVTSATSDEFDVSLLNTIYGPFNATNDTGFGMYVPNGTYTFKIILASTVSRVSTQARLVINGVDMVIPSFDMLNNTTVWTSNDIVVTDGRIVWKLVKSTTYTGTGSIGYSMVKIITTAI